MWKDEPLTNRRDADSKFHFLIPLEIFCTQLPGWEDTLLTHTDRLLHGETPASSQSWKLGLEGSASPGTLKLQFHNAQMQLRWAVRKMPTSVETGIPGPQWKQEYQDSVETGIVSTPARPAELWGFLCAQIRVAAPPHLGAWWVQHDTAGATAVSTSAWCGLDMLLC